MRILVAPTTGCWIWFGGFCGSGYPRWLQRDEYRAKAAHRAIYEIFGNTIPEGYQLDHLCNNRVCVNPDHMEPVPQRENLRRQHDRKAA